VEAGEAPAWPPCLVSEHLGDLAAGSTADFGRALEISEEQVLKGMAIIRERLRPFAAVETGRTETIPTADVVRRLRGEAVAGGARTGCPAAHLPDRRASVLLQITE
jgi:DNA-directed RNA polymerase specialized sigma54-like protein